MRYEVLLRSGGQTAIFCANDYIAVDRSRLRKAQDVPRDMSVIGFAGDEIGNVIIPVDHGISAR